MCAALMLRGFSAVPFRSLANNLFYGFLPDGLTANLASLVSL